MSINKDQARMLTALAVACRPVGAPRWDDEGTFRAIGKIQNWSLPIVIEHVIRHAADAKAKTPGVIGTSHTPAELGMPTPGPMRRGDECKTHIGERAESCSWCVRGVKAWDEIETPPAIELPPIEDVNPRLAQRLAARAQHTDHPPAQQDGIEQVPAIQEEA